MPIFFHIRFSLVLFFVLKKTFQHEKPASGFYHYASSHANLLRFISNCCHCYFFFFRTIERYCIKLFCIDILQILLQILLQVLIHLFPPTFPSKKMPALLFPFPFPFVHYRLQCSLLVMKGSRDKEVSEFHWETMSDVSLRTILKLVLRA